MTDHVSPASEEFDADAFEASYGFSPQRYLEKVAVGYALAPKLEAEEAELAEDKAALSKTDWAYIQDPETRQAAADAENKYLAQRLHVRGLKDHQKFAIAFSKGEITFAAFSSYFGTEGQKILRHASIDQDAVRAAVVAALAD